jgi:hypothetical protein
MQNAEPRDSHRMHNAWSFNRKIPGLPVAAVMMGIPRSSQLYS